MTRLAIQGTWHFDTERPRPAPFTRPLSLYMQPDPPLTAATNTGVPYLGPLSVNCRLSLISCFVPQSHTQLGPLPVTVTVNWTLTLLAIMATVDDLLASTAHQPLPFTTPPHIPSLLLHGNTCAACLTSPPSSCTGTPMLRAFYALQGRCLLCVAEQYSDIAAGKLVGTDRRMHNWQRSFACAAQEGHNHMHMCMQFHAVLAQGRPIQSAR
eukprot:365231-Chlamydomonas_euryale.AAC.5